MGSDLSLTGMAGYLSVILKPLAFILPNRQKKHQTVPVAIDPAIA